MSLIQVSNLTFAYEGSYDPIFENVSFQIDTNWRLGFTGRNGRGKTTFLNLLLGRFPYQGNISTSVSFSYFPYEVPDKTHLAINSCLLDGAAEGLKFYLLPDWDRFIAAGPGNVVVAAMNQSFFSLSLGIGSMAIFGSYLKKDRSLMGESVNVIFLDTFVALTAGLIVFPACSAFGVEAGQGPGLVFVTLPNIFNNMAGGRIWGSLFFLFMSFAAMSTVFAVFENIVACVRDLTGWERKKTSWICGVSLMVLCMPCVLGFTVLSHVQILGLSIMDFEDFLVSNILLPVGSLLFAIFCVCRYGWGWKNYTAEANTGNGLKVQGWMRWYMTWVVPVIIAFIFFYGLYNFFQ